MVGRWTAACGLLLLVVAAPAPAIAQPKRSPTSQPPPSASKDDSEREVFEQSAAAYRAGDFARAVELLQKAYAIKPAPVLLYNLARAYEGMGSYPEAVKAYRDYLRDEPQAADRGAIEKRVVTLEGKIAEQEQLRKPSVPPRVDRPREPEPEPSKAPVGAWIAIGGAGVAAATSVAFFLLASRKEDEADRERVQTKAADLADDARTYNTIGVVGVVSAGVLLAVGGTWLLLTRGERARPLTAFSASGFSATF